jgi:hypothetical protein
MYGFFVQINVVWSSREQGYPEGPSLEEEKQSRRRADAQAAILCEMGLIFSLICQFSSPSNLLPARYNGFSLSGDNFG